MVSATSDYKVWVVSDIHYLADSLHDCGSSYASLLAGGDNKNIELTGSLLDALGWTLKKEVSENKGNGCLVITGDLTLNGERDSHVALAARLKVISSAGIPVYVLPGNHDIDNPCARSYLGSEVRKVDSTSADDFARIYESCGYGQAISRDGDSLSYLVEPTKGLRLLLLDSTLSDSNFAFGYSCACGAISASTMSWVRACARQASSDGAKLVVAMHHSLIDHNSVINEGYTIENSDELVSLLSEIGVGYILTGHTHIQDIAEIETNNGALYDITTGALSVFPHNYGQLTFPLADSNASVEYSAHPVDVEAWAAATGKSDSRLVGFDAYAQSFFRERSSSMMTRLLSSCRCDSPSSASGLSCEQETQLVNLLVKLNTRFFSGHEELNESDSSYPAVSGLLSLIPAGFLSDYAKSIVADTGPSDNEIALP
jgi:Predicted phosphohydrolases